MKLCEKCGEYEKDCQCKPCPECAAKAAKIERLEKTIGGLSATLEMRDNYIKEKENEIERLKTENADLIIQLMTAADNHLSNMTEIGRLKKENAELRNCRVELAKSLSSYFVV